VNAAVRVEDAHRIYETERGGVAALQGLTLAVEEGEIVVVLGPSGSGKTTLLRVLAALEPLSAGSASVLGTDVARLGPRAAAAYRGANVGLLDQHYAQSLSPDLTCVQSVAQQPELLGRGRREARRDAESLLERVGLAGRGGERPATLSGGEQQRVALCAAIAHSPRLLLADEPAGELDAENAELVYRLLGELVRGSGATAVVVSHDRAAASIADRLVHVRDGRVVEEAPRGEEPALVVSRGGWVRLPEPLLRELGKPRLVTAAIDGERVVVTARELGAGDAVPSRRRVANANGGVAAELRRVTKRYGERVVLSGLSRTYRTGALTAVVGRSGSGKTTLLHLLAGLLRPSAGDVLVAGELLHGLSRQQLAELRRRSVALVTQEPGLVPYLSALENVELGLTLRGLERERACPALADVGLGERLDSRADRLSAGERQRLAIARALAVEAPLLLVDEPTARLDEENARAAGALLARAAHERGLAVVCATHDPVLIELADEVLELDPPTAHSSKSASVGA
jgi:ABC-type lipoprotein export system ATPase subunit